MLDRVSDQDVPHIPAINDDMGGRSLKFTNIMGNTPVVQQPIASHQHAATIDRGLYSSTWKVDVLRHCRTIEVQTHLLGFPDNRSANWVSRVQLGECSVLEELLIPEAI